MRSDFRVVTATNQRLEKLVADGRFRADLAHRIGAVVIDVPPLSDRPEDIPLLVQHFLSRAGGAPAVAGRSAERSARDSVLDRSVSELNDNAVGHTIDRLKLEVTLRHGVHFFAVLAKKSLSAQWS